MKYDISKPISQGSSGEKDAENHRIEKIANELRGCCQLHEKESRVGKEDGDIYVIDAEIKRLQ